MDAKKRFRSSRVCVLGRMSGLRCEVSKNLVLSGVKEVKMVDSKLVFEDTTSHRR